MKAQCTMKRLIPLLLMTTFAASANAQSALDQYLQKQLRQQQPEQQGGTPFSAPATPDPEKQAEAFTRIYATFCLKHIHELEKLRQRMAMAPQIPKEKAVNFLQGYEGEAWVVPEATGQYVIAMPKEKNMCFVYAYRAGQEKIQKTFSAIANAPAGSFHIKKGKDETKKMVFGDLHSVSYEWTLPGSPKRTILKLSTTSSEKAPMQAYAAATLITE